MIGLEGKVIEPLMPNGLISVKGEYWKAISTGGNIAVGENVEIIGLDGLTLRVKRKKRSVT
jgi:membrane-bound ClpP family serine protease